MRLLVCGDRHWSDYNLIFRKLEALKPDIVLQPLEPFVIIEGEARGADLMARIAAYHVGAEVRAFPAQWNLYGKAAGPIRNATMLHEGKPDLVLAFHDDIEHSKGTKDMLQKAKAAGVPAVLVGHTGERSW